MTDCLFCAAVAGSFDVATGYSSEETFAFLDHRPVFKRHVLVVPRVHVETLSDLRLQNGTGRVSYPPVAVRSVGEGGQRIRPSRGADMAEYLIYFNQQWVGDHTDAWFRGRGPLARAVVEEIKAAGAFVFAGGLEEEDGPVFSADTTSGALIFTDGPYAETKEWLGGLTVVDVADEEAARMWAGKIAEACGWPQEVRRFKPRPQTR